MSAHATTVEAEMLEVMFYGDRAPGVVHRFMLAIALAGSRTAAATTIDQGLRRGSLGQAAERAM